MNKLPTIRQLKELHTKFYNMYALRENCPVVSVESGGVHIDEDYATQYAPLEVWSVKDRGDKTYPIQIDATVNGLHLYAIMKVDKAKELGFVKEEIEQ